MTPAPRSEPEAPTERAGPWPRAKEGDSLASMGLRRPVTLTTGTLLLALPAVLVAGFILWGIAYNRGFTKGEQGVTRDLNLSPGVTDPLKSSQIPVNPNLIDRGSGANQAQSQPRGNPAPPPQPGNNRPAPAQVPAGSDPREVGLNYMMLASTMDKESAERAVAFLGQNGVPAFLLPVAKSSGGANNPGSFTLFAQQGITGEQYKARSRERTDLEDKVTRLAKVWQKEHRGQHDFARFYWDKKKP